MKRILTAAAAALLTHPLHAEELTIASWNIANLGAPGAVLRGYDRQPADYEEIKRIISDLEADVIAFQEIGSIAALEAVLPVGYSFAFESRCYANVMACENDADDIYNAIAVRSDLSFSFFQIDNLAILHQNECGDPARAVRGGVGVDLQYEGRRYLVPSLHLKATCKDNSVEPGTEDDCATQREQITRLRAWMDAQDPDATVILAGDFNRELLDPSDQIRQDFFADIPPTNILPERSTRSCWGGFAFDFDALADQARTANPQFDAEGATPWMFTPRSNTEIDFFVVQGLPDGATLSSDQIELNGAYVFRDPGPALTRCDGSLRTFSDTDPRVLTFAEAYPSDHCPITMTIRK